MSSNPHDTSLEKDSYILTRDLNASFRLAIQSLLQQQGNGYLMHPTIAASLHSNGIRAPQIAEVAAGQCYMTIALAEAYPDGHITALDLSSTQFPAPALQPKNASYAEWDMFSPLPEQYIAAFDVVHVRTIIGATFRKNTAVIYRNLRAMLKPGGWLQYQEAAAPGWYYYDMAEAATHKHPEPRSESALGRLTALLNEKAHVWTNFEAYRHLSGDLENAGFVDVQKFDTPVPPHLIDVETWNILALVDEVGGNVMRKKGSSEEDKAWIDEVWRRKGVLLEELGSGKRIAQNLPVWIGQRHVSDLL